MGRVFLSQTSMAHTRWATHGVPSKLNCHPHVSEPQTEFSSFTVSPVSERQGTALTACRRYHHQLCVEGSCLKSSYTDLADKELKLVLLKRGYKFNTDTDTEVVATLCKYVYDSQPNARLNFTSLITTVIKELVSTSGFPVSSAANAT